jgi:hypothetical protein
LGFEANGNVTHHRLGLMAMTTQNNIIVWGVKPLAMSLIIVWG